MTELSASERKTLADKVVGLPHKRTYPMPDVSHTRNAKAHATEEFNWGQSVVGRKGSERPQGRKSSRRVVTRLIRSSCNSYGS